MFRIYPAVDIKGGRCVRLHQGDLEKETVFSETPWEMALAWQEQGASYLHVVDLDGAAQDRLVNLDAVSDILARVRIPVQVGGGVRLKEDVEALLSLGAGRVIVGTRALADRVFLEELLSAYGTRVIVSLDTRGHELAVRGWRERLGRPLEEVVDHLLEKGVRTVIHTDISRDGTMRGYDAPALGYLLGRGLGVIAAGGIGSADDLVRLRAMSERGLEGAIVGRALYEGAFSLAEVLYLEED